VRGWSRVVVEFLFLALRDREERVPDRLLDGDRGRDFDRDVGQAVRGAEVGDVGPVVRCVGRHFVVHCAVQRQVRVESLFSLLFVEEQTPGVEMIEKLDGGFCSVLAADERFYGFVKTAERRAE